MSETNQRQIVPPPAFVTVAFTLNVPLLRQLQINTDSMGSLVSARGLGRVVDIVVKWHYSAMISCTLFFFRKSLFLHWAEDLSPVVWGSWKEQWLKFWMVKCAACSIPLISIKDSLNTLYADLFFSRTVFWMWPKITTIWWLFGTCKMRFPVDKYPHHKNCHCSCLFGTCVGIFLG